MSESVKMTFKRLSAATDIDCSGKYPHGQAERDALWRSHALGRLEKLAKSYKATDDKSNGNNRAAYYATLFLKAIGAAPEENQLEAVGHFVWVMATTGYFNQAHSESCGKAVIDVADTYGNDIVNTAGTASATDAVSNADIADDADNTGQSWVSNWDKFKGWLNSEVPLKQRKQRMHA